MKKVLLASTALVLSAGIASAQGVSITGSAEMGFKDDGTFEGTSVAGTAPQDSGVEFHTDINVDFMMSGETDGGLSFGAEIGLEEAAGGVATDVEDDFTVFISGDFGTLTMGDTDGALDWAMTEVLANSGSINDDEEHAAYNGNAGLDGSLDGQILRYDYSFGDFAFALSAELNDLQANTTVAGSNQDDIFGIGVTYSADLGGVDLGLGLGYQSGGYDGPDLFIAAAGNPVATGEYDADIWGVSVTAAVADFDFRLNYSDLDGTATIANSGPGGAGQTIEWDHIGVGVGYTFDAVSLHLNYGEVDGTHSVAGAFEASGWGFTAGYDLGGGAEIQFGYGSSDRLANATGAANPDRDQDTWSLGLSFSF
ncbi:MAG: porin [Pseudomonadota bacterium]